jgi:hypothetical protein
MTFLPENLTAKNAKQAQSNAKIHTEEIQSMNENKNSNKIIEKSKK